VELTILMPCLNEAQTVERLLQDGHQPLVTADRIVVLIEPVGYRTLSLDTVVSKGLLQHVGQSTTT